MIKEYGLYVSNWNCIQTFRAALAKVEFAVLLIFCSASFLYYLWLFNYKCLRPIPFVSHEVTNNNFKVLRDKSILLQNKRWNLQTKIESRRKNEIKKLNINSILTVLFKKDDSKNQDTSAVANISWKFCSFIWGLYFLYIVHARSEWNLMLFYIFTSLISMPQNDWHYKFIGILFIIFLKCGSI